MACKTAGLGDFLKKYVREKKKEREKKNISDLPMSQMRYQNMLI